MKTYETFSDVAAIRIFTNDVSFYFNKGIIAVTEDAWYDPNYGTWTHKRCFHSQKQQLNLF